MIDNIEPNGNREYFLSQARLLIEYVKTGKGDPKDVAAMLEIMYSAGIVDAAHVDDAEKLRIYNTLAEIYPALKAGH